MVAKNKWQLWRQRKWILCTGETGTVDVDGGGNLGEWWVGRFGAVEIKIDIWGYVQLYISVQCPREDIRLGIGNWSLELDVRYKFEGLQQIHGIWSQDHNFQDLVPTLPKLGHAGTSESPANHPQNMKCWEHHLQISLCLMVPPLLFFFSIMAIPGW